MQLIAAGGSNLTIYGKKCRGTDPKRPLLFSSRHRYHPPEQKNISPHRMFSSTLVLNSMSPSGFNCTYTHFLLIFLELNQLISSLVNTLSISLEPGSVYVAPSPFVSLSLLISIICIGYFGPS